MNSQKRLQAIRIGQLLGDTFLECLCNQYVNGTVTRKEFFKWIVENEMEAIKTHCDAYIYKINDDAKEQYIKCQESRQKKV